MAVAITLRSVKGAPLTIPEVDTNFTNLKNGIDGQQASVDAAVAAVNGMDARVDALEATTTDQGNRIVALETGGGGGSAAGGFFAASKNANQTISVNTSPASVKVSYNVESEDVAGAYDPATSLFTAPEAGWYFFVSSVRIDALSHSSPTGVIYSLYLKVNGGGAFTVAEKVAPDFGHVVGHTISASGAVKLSVGDTVAAYFESQLYSGSLTWQITSDGSKSYFQGWKVA